MGTIGTKIKEVVKHPLFTAIVGTAVGTVIGALLTGSNVEKNYIPVDSIDALIRTKLVDADLVDSSILNEEAPDVQFDIIATEILAYKDQISDYEDQIETLESYKSAVQDQLIDFGVSESDVRTKSDDWILTSLESKVADAQEKVEKTEELEATISTLENRETADIKSANLVISGEQIDSDIAKAVAVVDGATYYSETLLNTYITTENAMSYKDDTVVCGNLQPETISLTEDKTYNNSNIKFYAEGGSESFNMATVEYTNGLTTNSYSEASVYVQLNGAYSSISFEAGHIDGENMNDRTLYLYTKNKKDEFKLIKTITLTGEMLPDEDGKYEIPLSYANALKIVFGESWGVYGLTNIKLHS